MMENIYDKLITWANSNGYWAQYLLNLCFKYEEISQEELDNIINCYISNSFPAIIFKKLESEPSSKLYLNSIKNVKNVNLLLNNQEMNFNNNLTVVYGPNGTGKTGYVRIVKSMGNSLDSENTIYTNLLEDDIGLQSADVTITHGNTEETFVWSKTNCRNLNLKIFNSNCVKFSLGNKKEILFMPQDFNFFNIINVATSDLAKKAKERIAQLKSDMTLFGIIDGTKVHLLIDSIMRVGNARKNIEDFINNNSYNLDVVEAKLEELNKKTSMLNTDVIILQIRNKQKLKSKIEELSNLIFLSSGLQNKELWQEYKSELIKANELISGNVKIEDFVTGLNLEEKQKELFKEFLLVADKFLKSRNGISFEEEETCIFCGQAINEEAKDLLSSYSRFITNDNSAKINIIVDKIHKFKDKIKSCISEIGQIEPFFENEDSDFYKEVIKVATILQKLVGLDYNPLSNLGDFDSSCDLRFFKSILDATLQKYIEEISILNKQKDNIEKEISDNRARLNEYNSIAILLKNVDAIISNINEQLNLNPLSKISNSSLSAIQSKILSTKYKEKFTLCLEEQLVRLEAPKNINFSPNIVASKLSLKQTFLDKKYDLSSILSEGEQKVIALSHFIAENLIEDKDNVLVLDDPVNSLDLQRMETVARVLVQLSEKKQIIILTHNLVFVGFLSKYAKEILDNEEHTFICLERGNIDGKPYTGQIKYEFPNIETYKYYKSKVNSLVSNKADLRENKNHIYDCFSYMRSALELMVAEKVFNGTINRYEPDIKMTKFENINTDALKNSVCRISALFSKVCRFIPAHSSSPQARIEPTIEILNECYTEFKALDAIFNK